MVKWTTLELEQLIELVQERELNWKQIGQELGKSRNACRVQYRRIFQLPREIPPAYHWTTAELDRLKEAITLIPRSEKKYWTLVSEHVGTRSVISCQRRSSQLTIIIENGSSKKSSYSPSKGIDVN